VVKLTSEFRELSKALQERDEGLRQLLQQRDDSLWQAARESFFDALGKKLATFMQMSLAGHISKVVGAAVRDAFALKKAQPKKASKNSVEMPAGSLLQRLRGPGRTRSALLGCRDHRSAEDLPQHRR
jgi:hypothetical protein